VERKGLLVDQMIKPEAQEGLCQSYGERDEGEIPKGGTGKKDCKREERWGGSTTRLGGDGCDLGP